MTGWHARPDTRLTTAQAHHYAARLEGLRRWRVQVARIAPGISNVELRPLRRPIRPAIVLCSTDDCERALTQE